MPHGALVLLLAVSSGCAREPLPEWPVSPPAKLCGDPSLGENGFCMPAARIQRWLERGTLTILEGGIVPEGVTAPRKLRVQVKDGAPITFSVKFKPVPEDLDAFNNSPRRELAAYQLQRMFLDDSDYVVPPTALRCLPLKGHEEVLPEIEPFGETGCTLGVIAYWVENVTSDEVFDEERLEKDPIYRYHVGNLNIFTVLASHKDSIGENFVVAGDPARPRLLSIDNGLAFGGMGINPIQIWSDAWADLRLDTLPARTVARLRTLDRRKLDELGVVEQMEIRGERIVSVAHSEPMDPEEGAVKRGGVLQFGLTAEEITEIDERLAELLGRIDEGEVKLEEAPRRAPVHAASRRR